ncbi:hypothetical protein MFIFM68171_05660 [Madurella fahalii]|uniref:NmrA-like domain-containing protein n=1 Tax=Madurella fahalii TaxID=1157608 RepID=A0ABQ0GD35_9PEZI
MAKTITIVGATGAQGRGVATAFLNNPSYHVRAITRNPSSPSAQALAAQGAEVVQADLNSLPSLKSAFAGSQIVFGVTNFFEPFTTFQSPDKAMDVEVQQGINLALAASQTEGLEHYVWSTLPDIQSISQGKYVVPHFEGKSRVDRYIRGELPELAEKTTFLWVTFYAANYKFPMFTPIWVPSASRYVQLGSYAGETPITTVGDVEKNIGPFVKGVVEGGEKARGEIVLASVGGYTANEMLQLWAKVKGTEATFARVGGDVYREIWPLWGEEMGVMMEFWDEYKERSWIDVEGRKVLKKEDLGITGLEGLEEAYKTLEL